MSGQERTASAAADPLLAALERFEAAVSARITAALLELGLTLPQLRAFYIVHQLGQASGRQLARKLGISPASVVPLVDRLAQQGYVERVRDTQDRRVWWVRPTPRGAALMCGLTEHRTRVLAALAALPHEDRQRLTALLNLLADLATQAPATARTDRSRGRP